MTGDKLYRPAMAEEGGKGADGAVMGQSLPQRALSKAMLIRVTPHNKISPTAMTLYEVLYNRFNSLYIDTYGVTHTVRVLRIISIMYNRRGMGGNSYSACVLPHHPLISYRNVICYSLPTNLNSVTSMKDI